MSQIFTTITLRVLVVHEKKNYCGISQRKGLAIWKKNSNYSLKHTPLPSSLSLVPTP